MPVTSGVTLQGSARQWTSPPHVHLQEPNAPYICFTHRPKACQWEGTWAWGMACLSAVVHNTVSISQGMCQAMMCNSSQVPQHIGNAYKLAVHLMMALVVRSCMFITAAQSNVILSSRRYTVLLRALPFSGCHAHAAGLQEQRLSSGSGPRSRAPPAPAAADAAF